jgi:uncharacterized membrane protein YfcA
VSWLNQVDLSLITTCLYILTGAFAGFAAGLLGIGGGLIIVPVLYFIFSAQGYDQQYLMHMALTTSLATIVFTSISSTLAHHKKHAVLWRLVFLLSPGIIIGSWFGGKFASVMDTEILGSFFAVFELLVAINLLLKKQSRQHQIKINKAIATTGGIVIGFVSTVVGIGGATMTVPFLHWFNVSIRNAVATSAACGFPIALFGTLSFIYASWDQHLFSATSIGYLQLHALLIIATSSFIFAPLGAKLAHTISEKTLRLVFAFILLTLSITMFSV